MKRIRHRECFCAWKPSRRSHGRFQAAVRQSTPTTAAFDQPKSQRNLRVAFTFDDGWADTVQVALPIARECGIPTTIFICPERMNHVSPFWPERVVGIWRRAEGGAPTTQTRLLELFRHLGAHFPSTLRSGDIPTAAALVSFLKTLPNENLTRTIEEMEKIGGWPLLDDSTELVVDSTMTWEKVKSLNKEGIQFGSHTQTHPILSQVSLVDVETELVGSKRAIEEHLDTACSLFAYPNGSWTEAVRDQVAQAGYKLAFIAESGWWTPETDPYLIPRTCLCEEQLIGAKGLFFEMVLDYMVFWRSYRARRTNPAKHTRPSAVVCSSSNSSVG